MSQIVYSPCTPPLVVGCFLYTDAGFTTPVADGIYSDGNTAFTVSGGLGEITSGIACSSLTTSTTTTTTTAAPTTTTTTTTTTAAPTTTTTTTSTTTTTAAGSSLTTIQNLNTVASPSITDVSPAFFVPTSGTFPLNTGESLTGVTGAYTGILSITIVDTGGTSGKINVFINSSLVDCINVSSGGIYNTGVLNIASTDDVLIEYVDGSC